MPFQKPVLKLADEYQQLALRLDLPEVEEEGISVEAARVRSEAARSAFLLLKGKAEQPAWYDRFEKLVDIGWAWRQAVYIAWSSMPDEDRFPRSQDVLAKKYLGLTSDRAISTWKKNNPAIETTIMVLQSDELWSIRADAFKNLITGVKKSGEDYKFKDYLFRYLEMTGDYVPISQVAAVIKKKADGGAHEQSEDTLEQLAAAARELRKDLERDGIDIESAETDLELDLNNEDGDASGE
jgi:hypothetical protein